MNTGSCFFIEYINKITLPIMLKYQNSMGKVLSFFISEYNHWTTKREAKNNCPTSPIVSQILLMIGP